MTYRTAVEVMLDRYGQVVSVNGTASRAVIRPVQSKSLSNFYYSYTGPAELKLAQGNLVKTETRSYIVKRSDLVRIGGEAVYIRAILGIGGEGTASVQENGVVLQIGGKNVAYALSYTVISAQESKLVSAWGEQEPTAVAAGRYGYTIQLNYVSAEPEFSLYDLKQFDVVFYSGGKKIVYSGCEWKEISNDGEKMIIIAAKRQEEKEAQE